jgi:peptide/nickel transport system substrate-binding protein
MYGGHAPAGWEHADPAAAAAMLDADGWKLGTDGIRVKNGKALRLDAIAWSSSAQASSIMLQTQAMLARVGIALTVKTYPLAFYFARASSGGPFNGDKFDLGLEALVGGPDLDDETMYTCANRAPVGFNVSQYCNPAMDRLEAESETQPDAAHRRAIVAQIEALAVHDATYVFLYHDPTRFIFSPALRRIPPSLDMPWNGVASWSFAP